jgi:AraC-like DNA-binding protein
MRIKAMRVYKIEELTQNSKTMYLSKCMVRVGEPLHTHDFIEIVYILSGKITHIIDGQSYSFSRGDLIFMNYGCTHAILACDTPGSSYVNIIFSPETISESITPSNAFSLLALTAFNTLSGEDAYGKLTFTGQERKLLESIILTMHAECKERSRGWEDIIMSYFNVILTYMLRKSNSVIERREMDDTWGELLEYIERNLESKLTLSGLAQKCFYNPSYFSRVFKEKFGVSLTEYIMQKRLERAAELLEDSALPIEEIGFKVGFGDRSSFYHAFVRRYGIAPQQFRKKAQM